MNTPSEVLKQLSFMKLSFLLGSLNRRYRHLPAHYGRGQVSTKLEEIHPHSTPAEGGCPLSELTIVGWRHRPEEKE
jgi:hypothetical protein